VGHDWLLVEMLGSDPYLVSQGHRLRKFVPLPSFFRRSSSIDEIMATLSATAKSKKARIVNAPDHNTVIRTEPVVMSDGQVHGVHLWMGPPNVRPQPRTVPGAVVWDLTEGKATDTPQALWNAGMNLNIEHTHGRAFAEDMPIGGDHPDESRILAAAINCSPNDTLCSTWNVTSHDGTPIRVSFAARARLEKNADGTEHLVCRAMNWRVPLEQPASFGGKLANQILEGMAQDGIHRALLDLKALHLLKWLDPPCPHIDWRGNHPDRPFVHPDDRPIMYSMLEKLALKPVDGLLRLRSKHGQWALMHTTAYRVKLLDDTYAALVCIRLPTPAELAGYSAS
jgi:Family of unknown function (DUF5628)/Domain of unknown function (DUF5593)